MRDIVIVFGAGASAHACVPMMGRFWEKAEDLLSRSENQSDVDAFRKVQEFRNKLRAAQALANVDLYNIEGLLGCLEMYRLVNEGPESDQLYDAMVRLISRTIELTAVFDGSSEREKKLYEELRNQLMNSDLIHRVSMITFNYDLCLDMAFASRGIDYGFEEELVQSRVPVLKLHGSIHWYLENGCLLQSEPEAIPFRSAGPNGVRMIFSRIMEANRRIPVIVPPTYNKSSSHRQLRKIWSHASKQISAARSLIFVGYSLPSSDLFFRYLVSTAGIEANNLRRIFVYDVDESGSVEGRYRNVFSSVVSERLVYDARGFQQMVYHRDWVP